MQEQAKSQDVFARLAGKNLETLGLWADANQRVMRELVNLSATTAKETTRLFAELQSSAVEAIGESQSYWLKRQPRAPEACADPLAWYQKTLVESVEDTQKAFRFIEGNAQAILKSAEQLQATAERAGKEIQDTFSTLATKIQESYAAA